MSLLNSFRSSSLERRWLWLSLGAIVIGWFVFKLLYPYPDLVFDSYHYIRAAYEHQNINAWPIGYSKFLEVSRIFSVSANLFVTYQYIFQELAMLWLFLTWRALFRPGKWPGGIVFLFLFLNPLLMFCANFIMADSLFVTLSVLWITQLLWLIHEPKCYMIISNAVLLFIAFTVRYNALYYPVIGCLAFLLCRGSWRFKLVGMISPMVLIGVFILYTMGQYARTYGQSQFTPFGGWKIANDALFMYRHVYKETRDPYPMRFQKLDKLIQNYFDTSRNDEAVSQTEKTFGSPFMFYNDSPLLEYMALEQGAGQLPYNSEGWVRVAPLYQGYGSYLIVHHPIAFARYFVIPNIVRYLIPPGENYPFSDPFFTYEAASNARLREDFGFQVRFVKEPLVKLREALLLPFPSIYLIIHICFLMGALAFISLGGFKTLTGAQLNGTLLILSLWLIDFLFSIFSAAVVLRYEIFMSVLECSMAGYFLEYAYKRMDVKLMARK